MATSTRLLVFDSRSGLDQVQLRANGVATLTFSGRDSVTFSGTWSVVRDGVAQVSLNRLQNRIPVTGNATVQYRGDRVTSIGLTGSSRQRGAFELSFRSGRQHTNRDHHNSRDQRDNRDQRDHRTPEWKTLRGIKDLLEDIF